MNEEDNTASAADIALGVGKGVVKTGLKGLETWGWVNDEINDSVSLRNFATTRPVNIINKYVGKASGQKDPLSEDSTPDWLDPILDYSYKDLREDTAGGLGNIAGFITGSEKANDFTELAAQILLPDAIDFVGGVGYIDNLAKVPSKLKKLKTLKPNDYQKIIDFALNVPKKIGQKTRDVYDDAAAKIRGVKELATGGMFGRGGIGSGINDGWINPMRQPEIPQVVRQALGNAGIRDNGTFHFATYLKNRKHLTSRERRALAGLFMTDPMKGFTGKDMEKALTSYTNRVKTEFMKVYTPEFLAKYNIDASQIQLHHINALLSSLPLYDGVRYMSKEWMEITGTLLAKNVHSGHSLKNLRFLVGRSKDFRTPHGITHKYLDEVVGPDGSIFFNGLISHNGKSITRLEYMKLSDANRIEVVNDWADIVTKGNSITDQAVGVFNAINADLLNLKAENIDEIMLAIGKLEVNGLVKPELIDGKWQIAANEMRELLFDIDFTENIGQHFLLADPQGLRALRIALQSDNPISAYKAIRETLPKQLSLFSDDKIKSLSKKTSRINKNQKKYFNDPDVTKPPK